MSFKRLSYQLRTVFLFGKGRWLWPAAVLVPAFVYWAGARLGVWREETEVIVVARVSRHDEVAGLAKALDQLEAIRGIHRPIQLYTTNGVAARIQSRLTNGVVVHVRREETLCFTSFLREIDSIKSRARSGKCVVFVNPAESNSEHVSSVEEYVALSEKLRSQAVTVAAIVSPPEQRPAAWLSWPERLLPMSLHESPLKQTGAGITVRQLGAAVGNGRLTAQIGTIPPTTQVTAIEKYGEGLSDALGHSIGGMPPLSTSTAATFTDLVDRFISDDTKEVTVQVREDLNHAATNRGVDIVAQSRVRVRSERPRCLYIHTAAFLPTSIITTVYRDFVPALLQTKGTITGGGRLDPLVFLTARDSATDGGVDVFWPVPRDKRSDATDLAGKRALELPLEAAFGVGLVRRLDDVDLSSYSAVIIDGSIPQFIGSRWDARGRRQIVPAGFTVSDAVDRGQIERFVGKLKTFVDNGGTCLFVGATELCWPKSHDLAGGGITAQDVLTLLTREEQPQLVTSASAQRPSPRVLLAYDDTESMATMGSAKASGQGYFPTLPELPVGRPTMNDMRVQRSTHPYELSSVQQQSLFDTIGIDWSALDDQVRSLGGPEVVVAKDITDRAFASDKRLALLDTERIGRLANSKLEFAAFITGYLASEFRNPILNAEMQGYPLFQSKKAVPDEVTQHSTIDRLLCGPAGRLAGLELAAFEEYVRRRYLRDPAETVRPVAFFVGDADDPQRASLAFSEVEGKYTPLRFPKAQASRADGLVLLLKSALGDHEIEDGKRFGVDAVIVSTANIQNSDWLPAQTVQGARGRFARLALSFLAYKVQSIRMNADPSELVKFASPAEDPMNAGGTIDRFVHSAVRNVELSALPQVSPKSPEKWAVLVEGPGHKPIIVSYRWPRVDSVDVPKAARPHGAVICVLAEAELEAAMWMLKWNELNHWQDWSVGSTGRKSGGVPIIDAVSAEKYRPQILESELSLVFQDAIVGKTVPPLISGKREPRSFAVEAIRFKPALGFAPMSRWSVVDPKTYDILDPEIRLSRSTLQALSGDRREGGGINGPPPLIEVSIEGGRRRYMPVPPALMLSPSEGRELARCMPLQALVDTTLALASIRAREASMSQPHIIPARARGSNSATGGEGNHEMFASLPVGRGVDGLGLALETITAGTNQNSMTMESREESTLRSESFGILNKACSDSQAVLAFLSDELRESSNSPFSPEHCFLMLFAGLLTVLGWAHLRRRAAMVL